MRTGHKLSIRFGTTPDLIKLSTTGGPFDLGVVPREFFGDAAAKAQFAAGPFSDVARAGLGVAVQSGVAKPDIATPQALKLECLPDQSAGQSRAQVHGPAGRSRRLRVARAQASTGR